MVRSKKASTDLKTIQQATEKKIAQTHSNLPEKKLKIKARTLEPDPWTGKQRPNEVNDNTRN